MKRAAIRKCRDRLHSASTKLQALREATSQQAFKVSWIDFLFHSKGIYDTLRKGAEGFPASVEWATGKYNARLGDPLLNYMVEARNDEEHGLGSSLELQPERHEFGFGGGGFSGGVRLDGGQFRNVIASGPVLFTGPLPAGTRVRSLDGRPVQVRSTPATIMLIPVTPRRGPPIPPPGQHLGQPLTDASPLAVAELFLVYLETLVAEAGGLVQSG